MDKGNVNVGVTKGQLIVDYYAVLLTIRVQPCLYMVSTTTRPCCSVLSVCALSKHTEQSKSSGGRGCLYK